MSFESSRPLSSLESLLQRCLLPVLLALGMLVASFAFLSPAADAMTRHTGMRVVHIAASKKGTPYRYGAVGPRAFDCSGFTRWVMARVGRHLPHNAAAQKRVVRHVTASHRRPGDLVFFASHGHVYHVAIYAGHDRIWHAPRPGQRVHLEHLWTHRVSYGRVR
jgi:cell wall-associated NlpC family hydrolase